MKIKHNYNKICKEIKPTKTKTLSQQKQRLNNTQTQSSLHY